MVTTKSGLDFETTRYYSLPVYAVDETGRDGTATKSQFDVAILSITVTDVNDHAPKFKSGSCYPLSVPENNDVAVVHTVVASDQDSGTNGEVVYSITGR